MSLIKKLLLSSTVLLIASAVIAQTRTDVFPGKIVVQSTAGDAASIAGGVLANRMSIDNAVTLMRLNETDGTFNEKIWYWQLDSGVYRLYLANDAENAFTSVFSIDRNLTVNANWGFGPMDSMTLANAATFIQLFTPPANTETAHIDLQQDPAGIGAAGNAPYVAMSRNAISGRAGTIRWVRGNNSAVDHIWPDISGNLRIHTAPPSTGVSDSAGVVVGTQTSTRESKNIYGEFTDAEGALQTILQTKTWNFDYRSGAYNRQQFVGITTDDAPVFGMDEGRSFNPVNAFGYTVQSFKAIATRIMGLGDDVAELRDENARLRAVIGDLDARLVALEHAAR